MEGPSAQAYGHLTRGLDSNVPVEDYGVEWLGEIPAHWDVIRVKAITAEHKQGFYTKQAYVDEGVKLARITDIDDYAKRFLCGHALRPNLGDRRACVPGK
ncbi:MAG: hypothetical protein WAU45_07165 [Blastocatellia bacterium]